MTEPEPNEPTVSSPRTMGAERAPLADADKALLDLEARTYRSLGSKERDIQRELSLTPMQYHVHLAILLDDPAAVAYAPAVIRRARERAGK